MSASGSSAKSRLELDGVDAGYGRIQVLFGVCLEIAPGEVVGVLGPNGAGKTTLARVASGLVANTSGQVLLDGVDLTGAPAHRFARSGVTHVVQGRSVFGTLSVEDNLRLGLADAEPAVGIETALERLPLLADRRHDKAGQLSGGEQRMLSLGRALLCPPPLLILDEPSFGLAPVLVTQVFDLLAELADTHSSILVIEQQTEHTSDLADRVLTMERGRITSVEN